MVSIYELLAEEEEKVKELNSLRTELVEEYRLRELDEANAWKMDFKSIGATTDKLRSKAVQRKMNQFPNIYAQKKAQFDNIETELKSIRNKIKVMLAFEVQEIEFSKDSEDTDKESGE